MRFKPESITTTCGEEFTWEDSQSMARLVFRRWGRDKEAALCAWRRLMQNSTDMSGFIELLGEKDAVPHNVGVGDVLAVMRMGAKLGEKGA